MQRATIRCILICILLSSGCAAATRPRPNLGENRDVIDVHADRLHDRSQIGAASYYHSALNGRRTANGETYDDRELTAAHLTLDFGTRVRVTNLANAKSVVVKVNDRGPFVRGRIIDLSRRAASVLGFVRRGVARVRVDPLS